MPSKIEMGTRRLESGAQLSKIQWARIIGIRGGDAIAIKSAAMRLSMCFSTVQVSDANTSLSRPIPHATCPNYLQTSDCQMEDTMPRAARLEALLLFGTSIVL